MLFNSLEFAIFFPIVTTLYFILPMNTRVWMLLIASCYFYMAFVPKYILILIFTILIDYVAGVLISRANGGARRYWLVTSIVANVGVLAFFKYFNFINDSIGAVVAAFGHTYPLGALGIVLPIGLSFHTFQSMSYTIEVYRGRQDAERNLGRFALYVMFYPQLVAGPIERPQNLLEQFKIAHTFDYNRVKYGLQLMAWGLFKKIAIADRLARGVSEVYQDPAAYSGVAALTATYLFAVQIYCDFSGYSDVAIGAAEVMGFRLMRNFDRPYFSQTISEFWRRWHISLSTWFRDYLYIPLGGNRVSKSRLMVNLMLVFMLSGLWHGANWTFVIWGTLHGLYLCSAIMLTNVKSLLLRLSGLRHVPILHRTFSRLFTFHLVLLSWIFFRAANLSQAIVVLRAIVTNHTGRALSLDVMGGRTMLILCIGSLVACELMQSRIRLRAAIARSAVMIRWPVYVGSVLFLLLLGDFVSKQQFIYFQF